MFASFSYLLIYVAIFLALSFLCASCFPLVLNDVAPRSVAQVAPLAQDVARNGRVARLIQTSSNAADAYSALQPIWDLGITGKGQVCLTFLKCYAGAYFPNSEYFTHFL